jgi:hypothetical protein
MAGSFRKLHEHVRGGQGPLADFHIAKIAASRTRLRLVEQLGLLKGKVLGNVPDDSLAKPTRGGFDASKGSVFSNDLLVVQIDVKFLGEPLDRLLVFQGPIISEHKFILELRNAERRQKRRISLPKFAEISY